jgi:hypothetical protein
MLQIFSAFGLSASAGLNAYLPLLIVAISARVGWITLQKPFAVMTDLWVIAALVVLTLIELFVDKLPLIDHVNDVINTLVRPAAGALLFAASANVITDIHPALSIILGLVVAGSVHAAKSAVRPVVTATTAGLGNPIISTIEDVISAATALAAVLLPWLVLLIATLGIVLFLWWRLSRIAQKEKAA